MRHGEGVLLSTFNDDDAVRETIGILWCSIDFSHCLTQGKRSTAQSPKVEQLILAAAVDIHVGLVRCLGDLLARTSTDLTGRQSSISQRTAAL